MALVSTVRVFGLYCLISRFLVPGTLHTGTRHSLGLRFLASLRFDYWVAPFQSERNLSLSPIIRL